MCEATARLLAGKLQRGLGQHLDLHGMIARAVPGHRDIGQRADQLAEEFERPDIVLAAPADEARPKDVEPRELERLQRLLHFALGLEVEVVRTVAGPGRGYMDEAMHAGLLGCPGDVEHKVMVDRTKRFLVAAGFAPGRAERANDGIGADIRHGLSPAFGRRYQQLQLRPLPYLESAPRHGDKAQLRPLARNVDHFGTEQSRCAHEQYPPTLLLRHDHRRVFYLVLAAIHWKAPPARGRKSVDAR